MRCGASARRISNRATPALRFLVPRRIRNVVSNGTGRPVEPLSLPERQAVPAMSRCAHLYFLAKRARKHAAVTLPAGRPPMLAMSANGLLICSW